MLDSNLFLEQNKILQSNIVEFQQKSAQYCQNFCIGSELEFYVFSSLSPLVSAQSERFNVFLENVVWQTAKHNKVMVKKKVDLHHETLF